MPLVKDNTNSYVFMNRDTIDFQKEPATTLFRKLLIPTLLGSIAMSAVSTIDGIFVGHGVGADGVAAVNIVVPIYQLIAGLGLMIGSGCSIVSTIHLSYQKQKVARINITQALVISTLFTVAIVVAVLLFPIKTARLLGTSETLQPLVLDYLKWIMPAFAFEIWMLIGLFIIRLDGSPRFAMWCNIVPALLNIILDWLFIFPLGMGVKGAAIATMASLVTGGLMAASYLLFFARSLRLIPLKISTKSLRLAWRNIGYQCKIGSSSLLGELTMAVFIYIGNWQFMRYLGDSGVGAFGIACYYTPFFFMIGNAIAQSAQPIISYNYGIGHWQHIRETRRLLLRTTLAFGGSLTILFIFFPKGLVGLFVDTQSPAGEMASAGFPYLGTGIIFFITNIAAIGYFQSLERIKESTLFVLMRGFILLIPSFYLLPFVFGAAGMWLAMPVTEILTSMVIYAICQYRREKR